MVLGLYNRKGFILGGEPRDPTLNTPRHARLYAPGPSNIVGNVTDSMDTELETISYPGADDIDSDSFDSLVADLMKVASIEQVYRWKDECIRKMPNGDMAFLCLKDILRMYEPGITGYKPCIKSYTHYIANPSQLPQVGTLFTCDVCEK